MRFTAHVHWGAVTNLHENHLSFDITDTDRETRTEMNNKRCRSGSPGARTTVGHGSGGGQADSRSVLNGTKSHVASTHPGKQTGGSHR